MKSFRQAAILDIVGRERVTSQEVLRTRLAARGLVATQATLSRDIKQLGLVKRARDGTYQGAGAAVEAGSSGGPAALTRAVSEYLRRIDRVAQFVVLKTDPGQAQPLAVAIDRAGDSAVVGTIAGDDTILVIARSDRRAGDLVRRFERMARA